MVFKEISIERFRGIEKLEIKDLAELNILVGENNCGKTTVLEAWFLLAGAMYPSTGVLVQNIRLLAVKNNAELRLLFHQLKTDLPIVIQGRLMNETTHTLTISPFTNEGKNVTTTSQTEDGDFITPPLMRSAASEYQEKLNDGLLFDVKYDSLKKEILYQVKKQLTISANRMVNVIDIDEKKSDGNKGQLFFTFTHSSPFNRPREFYTVVEELVKAKKIREIVEILQSLEPDIQDIRVMDGGVIFVDIGLDEYVPINILGDGLIQLFYISVYVLSAEGGISVIDEIDTGLHYSALEKLWRITLAVAKKYNVQLIITTHSDECIRALSAVLREETNEIRLGREDVKLFRLQPRVVNRPVVAIEAEVLEGILADNWEYR